MAGIAPLTSPVLLTKSNSGAGPQGYASGMTLKIAVQKSGRMHDDTLELLRQSGIKVNKGLDQLKAQVHGFDGEVLFLRNSDIPRYVEDGIADLAVVGENTILEKGVELTVIEKLGFGGCRLSIAVPSSDCDYSGLTSLQGKRIATSYPVTLASVLAEEGIQADIHEISGSVEIAPNIGLADAICDLVSSGSTLFKNNLVEKDVLLHSEAVLVANSALDAQQRALVDQLAFRIRSVLKARNSRYVLMNVPNHAIDAVAAKLPGMKSPTVVPLVEEGWSSLHSVISEDDFWACIEQLRELGAEGILIIPIEKMVL